ncbi:relaxase/mobilization nuclease domain-containing protein [Helicobacter pylori]
MQDFINGFLKAWKAWSDDGKDAFLESFLDEVKNSKTDPSNFLGILEQEIKSLSQEGLKDDISSMLEVIESMKNEISYTKDNENVSDFFNAFQQEINEEQSISNDNPSEFVESLEKVIVETQNANKHEIQNSSENEVELTEEKSFLEMSEDEHYEYQQEQHIQMNEYDGIARATDGLEQQELEREEAELESKALQDYEENQIQRAGEISIAEHKNKLEKEELERYALEGENKALEQYYESQNPDTLYEQQVAQEQSKEEELSNKQDLELETLRDNNTKQGLDNESATLLESLQVIRDETNEVANYLRANEIDYLRPTGENTTSKIASIALEESNKLNEKEPNTQEQGKYAQKEQEKKTPSNDIDLKDKYASLHSFFKQTELDIKQKRIKTKLDFKESFLNYAKNHMNEDELKVLLVVSQKEPTKLTKEHINLIKDCLEQAHGNKHMQDKGLQLSVKSILGHQLEKEHHEVLKDYLVKSKDSLEPMDNRVYEVMRKHLDKQQAKTLKNLDSATQSVGVNAIKEQNKANENAQQETKNSQAQETTSSQAYESVSQANTQATTQANESIKPQTNNTATQQENAKESQAIEQNRATQEPHAKEEPKKVSHPDEPWLDYNPKAHAGVKERQENQEKTPSKGNDEPWIEYGKLMQEKAKAHYQAMVEKERAKQQAQQNAKNTNSINTPNKEVAIMDYGYTQSAPAKSRKR